MSILDYASLARPHAETVESDPLGHLSRADRRRFVEFGWGPAATPTHLLLHQAFEAQVGLRPDAVAVEHGADRVTYRELDVLAETVAARLAADGVGRGDLVGLFVERSIPMVAAMLGTLKVGAAYVPQHAGVAPERQLTYIVERTGTAVVLTLFHLRHHLPALPGVEVLDVDLLLGEVDRGVATPAPSSIDTTPLRPTGQPDDPCFVLFTSGTTGPPNGVVVTHRNVANIVLTEPGDLGIKPGMRVGQILSIAFDMAEWEIHGAITHGATLVIRGADIEACAADVDVLIATPSILASIDAERCRQRVRVVAVAGEPCPVSLADTWSGFARFHNSCGPTETTIVNTVQRYDGRRGLTIGAPTPNNTVYVLDEHLKPLPIGEVGEMWAGGDCVTAGYLGSDDRTDGLNADRYRDDPFLGGGRTMFRTRDLGRWTADGQLEHFGRTDDQVKVRGFRVELDSVSSVLEAQPTCERVVVLKYDDRHLVAFAEPATVHPEAAAAAVGEALPYYCVPARIFAVDRLPRTDRGKIDKRALRELAERTLGSLDAEAVVR
ncbi:MAG: AMP-binding protein [Actinomycetota bacterium]